MRFEGTSGYVATDDLKVAVNAAITLERPLLVKGEPGTGKTVLALEVAKSVGAPLIEWHVKSTTKAQQGLYEYDAVSRLRDSQLGDERFNDIRNYIRRGKLWDAFAADRKVVLLIDEIDKADIEFPNDLLQELDRMEFFVYEIGDVPGLKKKPSTSEALDWIRLLVADDIAPEDLRADPKNALPKLHGALLKNEQDVHLFERLAFMARR